MRWWLVSVTLAASCASPPPDWCTDKAPDEACFRTKRPVDDPRLVRAVEVAEAYMSRHPATGLEWGWEEGVLATALSELHRVTGDEALERYLRDYLDHHTEAGVRFEVSDDCPPAAVAAYLGGYDELLAAMNRYLDHEALRTPEGLLNHNGVLELIPPSAWLDSLFMVGMPLMRQVEFQGRDDRLTLLSEQLAGFIGVLSDDSGFFTHADEHWINAQDEGVFWARGNAWVTAAMGEYLRLKRNRGERDERVERALQKQVEALASQQDASGRWWTLLSHPGEVYQETSATALFAFGMARAWRYGALDDSVLPVVHRAIDGVLEKIEARAGGPVVVDVSGPTMAGTRAVYSEVPLREDLSFGVGAVILALIETSGLPK